jgi:hypothetical protein
MRAIAVLPTVLVLLCAGCPPKTGGGTAKGRSDHTFRHEWTLRPGKAAEVNLHFGAGASAEAHYKASDIVQWNVHSHPGKEVVTHEQGEGTYGTIPFRAPSEGVYSFMWQNDNSSAVTLTVEISGGVRLESYQPRE